MNDSRESSGSLRAALPYRLRWGEAIYRDMRAEWRHFLPNRLKIPIVEVDEDGIAADPGFVEGSAEWRRMLPDRRDLEALRLKDQADQLEMEYDDGKPVFYLPRKLLNLLIIAALIALLAYEFYGLFTAPAPPVPTLPAQHLDQV
ncbi:MAG: hypothetical protein U0670_01660 [Anaerolineae bacterium]